MLLYLVRHGVAGNADASRWPDDRERPLTPDGEKKFAEAAEGLAELVASVDLVLSSPLVRAWQTAAILEKRAGWPEPRRFDVLAGAAPAEVVDGLQPHSGAASIALVGHEPSLSELASYLLTGDPDKVSITLRKGGVICLESDDGAPRAGGAHLLWMTRPRILRAISR
jgi:phosphohistidine phosphatase